MPTLYEAGTHRLIYKAQNFGTGKTVTAYIWNPSLTKSALQTLTEVSDGLYYLDYDFTPVGTYFGKFYEGGTATTMGTFRVTASLDTAIPASPTAGSINEYVRNLKWAHTNKMLLIFSGANEGNVTIYKDDDSTAAFQIVDWVTEDSTTVTRLRLT